MTPLIHSKRHRTLFLSRSSVYLLLACALVPLKLVQVKMLPFDNKSEFQVIVDMPDGTTLEQTARVVAAARRIIWRNNRKSRTTRSMPARSGPYNFNGLVRHYFLRSQPNQADIQVNLRSRGTIAARRATRSPSDCAPNWSRSAVPFGARIKVS